VGADLVRPSYRAVKPALDVVLSLVALVLAAPIMAAVALAVFVKMGTPVLFRQQRPGRHGEPFVIHKFRTMTDERDASGNLRPDAERLTPLGRFLRKTSIDELPQLLNVLKGDMSLVGPRPERPEFISELREAIPFYTERHFVKPGITGWAQIKYPYGASVEDSLEKLRYDLFYIKHLSFFLDLLILVETAKVMLFGRGGR